VFFSRNTLVVTRSLILASVGVSSTQRYKKHLGIPALVGRSKASVFSSIKGRFRTEFAVGKRIFSHKQGKK
jgi:hypothetical protein